MSLLLLAVFGAAMLIVVAALVWLDSHDEHRRLERIEAARQPAAPGSGLLPV